MTHPTISPQRREHLLEWVGDAAGGATIQEIADAFEVHYQTAFTWVKLLEEEKLLTMVEGKKPRRYVATGATEGMRDIRVRMSGEMMSAAAWSMRHLTAASIPSMAHAFVYLFVRSYYYDAPDHQHLRGSITPLEVRDLIEERLKTAEEQLAVVRQLLSLRTPWSEGPTFAMRFGTPPVGMSMQDAVDAARFFSQVIMKNSLTSTEGGATMEGQEVNERGTDAESE